MSLHRRHFLQAATALAVPGTALAKAPMAGSQMLGVHRMKLGDFEVTPCWTATSTSTRPC
jgi:hypothetical protein